MDRPTVPDENIASLDVVVSLLVFLQIILLGINEDRVWWYSGILMRAFEVDR